MGVELIFQIVATIGVGATAIMAYVLVKTLRSNQKGLLVSNFSVITNYTGDETTRQNRRIIYNSTKQMSELLQKYPNLDDKLKDLNESAKQISAIYNRVGFLLKQDSKLEEQILDYHGFTIGIMWKMIEPLHDTWKEKDKTLDYKEFKNIGEKGYVKFSTDIDKFIQNKKQGESS